MEDLSEFTDILFLKICKCIVYTISWEMDANIDKKHYNNLFSLAII